MDKVLVLLRQLGHHAQGEGVVLVVQVWVLDFIVEEAVSSPAVLRETFIFVRDYVSHKIEVGEGQHSVVSCYNK